MPEPEVMHSSASADTEPGLIHTVSNQNVQMIVEHAREQLRDLTRQRQEIAQRVAMIKRTINGLASLYGEELRPKLDDDATVERRSGITNACRSVLNQAQTPLNAREVHRILQEEFPELFEGPVDHYASIVTVLNRLVKYGEASTFRRDGSRFWQRHQSDNRRPVGLSGI